MTLLFMPHYRVKSRILYVRERRKSFSGDFRKSRLAAKRMTIKPTRMTWCEPI